MPGRLRRQKPPLVPSVPEIPVFPSLHAAQLYLAADVGSATAASLAGDVYSHWGPKICSDGWHLDYRNDSRVRLARCNCAA